MSANQFYKCLPVSLALLVAGCAGVPRAGEDLKQQAQTFAPAPGVANIYIYRPSMFRGGGYDMPLTLDHMTVGKVPNDTFVLLKVAAGSHSVGMSDGQVDIALDAEEGHNYFFHTEPGWVGPVLEQVDEGAGRMGVLGAGSMALADNSLVQVAATLQRQRQPAQVAADPSTDLKLTAPLPITGNGGKYMSPFTASGDVALWAMKVEPVPGVGNDIASSVGGAVGQQIGQKALEVLPFGLGGMLGQQAGKSVAKNAAAAEAQVPTEDMVRSASDISFDSANELAVYMYAKHARHPQYTRILLLTQKVYPELATAYAPAITQARKLALPGTKEASAAAGKSLGERLQELQKLKSDGLITEDDFNTSKHKILESL